MAWWRGQHPLSHLFEYTTVKYVVFQNKKVGLLYRIFQLIVMGYLIGWVFMTKKGYQAKDDTLESSVMTKVKGVALVNTTELKLWGPEDYVIPAQGQNFVFIVTNFIETPNQTLGSCSENPSLPDAVCNKHDDCQKGLMVRAGNGIKTGLCLKVDERSNGTCEIYDWCPTERTEEPDTSTVVRQAENFTLYIRNIIRFSQFNFSKSNIKNNEKDYLKSCLHNEISHPYCPIFRLGDIVKKAGLRFEEFAIKGGSIGVLVEWSCDLDKEESNCHPNYNFIALGSNSQSGNITYNFRIAHYNIDATGQRHRTLYKVYGIRFDIMVFGMARRFSIIPTIINIASILTLMTVGSFFCDVILLCMMKNRTVYRESKFEKIKMSDKEIMVEKIPVGMKRKFSL